MGTYHYVPMFVPNLGLIESGQTYVCHVCPQLWAFCIKIILLWLIGIFGKLVVSPVLVWACSELLASTRYLWASSVGQEGHTSQRSNSLVAFRRPNIGRESSLPFFIEFDKHSLQQ